jgi:hypothetical protein
MVRLLVEEARHALPLPDDPQRKRDARPVPSTSTAGAHPAQRVVLRPLAEGPLRMIRSKDTEYPRSTIIGQEVTARR